MTLLNIFDLILVGVPVIGIIGMVLCILLVLYILFVGRDASLWFAILTVATMFLGGYLLGK